MLSTFWDGWLLVPLRLLDKYFGTEFLSRGGFAPLLSRIAVIVVGLILCYEVYSRIKKWRREKNWRKDLMDIGKIREPGSAPPEFTDTLEATGNLKATVEPLKKAKKWDRVAEIYASANEHKKAAKYFAKARNRKRAAEQWVRAGYALKAARLFRKEGDHATAARFFEEAGKHATAADAYTKAGDLPCAAAAYAHAGKVDTGARMFNDYFAGSRDNPQKQLQAAEACLAMLHEQAGVPADVRAQLTEAVAGRYEQAGRLDLAARLFYDAGHKARAGGVYAKAGKLQEAAKCMKEAGKHREASLIGAQYYESLERWAEAGMAYAGGEEFRRAGDCFSKANDAARAAECYERAGEHYGAALAYSHQGRFEDAIRNLQQIKENEKSFALSRPLLGRCFYEMHDYDHCAATLDNHLMNTRVVSNNVEYFYMLALACEQLGQLQRSREILLRIQTVNVLYRDVEQRLSSISSRISLAKEASSVPPSSSGGIGAPQVGSMMESVENLLGGRYRLDRELGRGGMGTVFLAHDTQLDRPVALKFLGALVDSSDEYRQRFIREAKAAAKVNHPNIVSIYDISASLGKAYIAMEFVDGPSMHRYLNDHGKLTPREAINFVVQACSALDAVHKAGIVHRDIKPDNMLVASGGLIKLADFGLAKADTARITGTGVVMGTPAYMSPEQTRHSDVDARTDIYAIGLILHEMLTGECVFRDGDVLTRQQEELPPAPGSLVADVPPELDAIVMKCIAKSPDDRVQTAADLLEALRAISV
ncbi:MAG: protein kinase [Nitrospiraceae bacterium]|nr:protein kinase [Nitrospiraceae bacterium]